MNVCCFFMLCLHVVHLEYEHVHTKGSEGYRQVRLWGGRGGDENKHNIHIGAYQMIRDH